LKEKSAAEKDKKTVKVKFQPRQSCRSDSKPRRETFQKDRMINGIEGSRQIKKSKSSDFLEAHGFNDMIMNREKSRFSRV
jgi:hypothetical protein